MDEVQVGDVFEPKGGSPSQAIEVYHVRPDSMAECRVLESGVTFTAMSHMLLDPVRWVRAGYMGSRVLPPTQPKADHVVPPLYPEESADRALREITDQKIKQAAAKVPLNLLPLSALAGTARVFQYGAAKYAAGNFIRAQDDEAPNRYLGALQRHNMAMQARDGLYSWTTIGALDAESGLPDIDHAIASLVMLRAVAIETGALPLDPGPGRTPPMTSAAAPGKLTP